MSDGKLDAQPLRDLCLRSLQVRCSELSAARDLLQLLLVREPQLKNARRDANVILRPATQLEASIGLANANVVNRQQPGHLDPEERLDSLTVRRR